MAMSQRAVTSDYVGMAVTRLKRNVSFFYQGVDNSRKPVKTVLIVLDWGWVVVESNKCKLNLLIYTGNLTLRSDIYWWVVDVRTGSYKWIITLVQWFNVTISSVFCWRVFVNTSSSPLSFDASLYSAHKAVGPEAGPWHERRLRSVMLHSRARVRVYCTMFTADRSLFLP